MSEGIYGALAPYYNKLQQHLDYGSWADFFERAFSLYFDGKVKDVLDLGCGTGSMTLELCRRGYDMIGIDISPEMLALAAQSGENEGMSDKLLWLCQDMRSFELYGTVEATVSCLDCLNHLTDTKQLAECFSLVHNYLVPNGLFIFDLNSKYKFENIYADNSFVFEEEGIMCVWQNFYNRRTHLCDFCISLFEEDADGRYTRTDEYQRERMYPVSTVKKLLKRTGFDVLGIYGDLDFTPATDEDERLYVIARAKK